jgi:hypothetical protein
MDKKEKWTKGQMDKMTNGQNDKWTKGQMDKRTNGQKEKKNVAATFAH